MAEILALDWSKRRIRAVVARIERDGLHVTGGFDEAWPDSAAPAEHPTAAGDWLGERVRACGYTGSDVRICLPRASATVRRLDLPAVPPEDLPPMVEMQAATRSSSGLEGLALDFVPIDAEGLPEAGDEEGCSVLAATTSRSLLNSIVAICDAAGLRVTWVGLGPFASAELVVRATQRAVGESALLVSVHDQTLETTLVRGNRVLFSQSSEIHGESDDQIGKAISADVVRSLVAHGNGLSATALDHVWWLGDAAESEPRRTIVSGRLRVTVEPFDPFDNAVVRSDGVDVDGAVVAGPLGAIFVGEGARVEQFDFLAPRKPPKKIDLKRRRMVIAASVAAVLLVGTLIWRYARLSSLSSRIAALTSEEAEMQRYVSEHAEVTARAAEVREWESLRRDWLADIASLENQFPDRDRALLTELKFDAGPRAPFGHVQGKGKAKTREEVEEFQNGLGLLGYTVEPREIPNTGTGADYDVKFEIDVQFPDPNQSSETDGETAS